jgi:hypothetical protein
VLVQRIAAEGRIIGAASLSGAAHPLERNRPFCALVNALELRPRSADPRRARIGRLISARANWVARLPRRYGSWSWTR